MTRNVLEAEMRITARDDTGPALSAIPRRLEAVSKKVAAVSATMARFSRAAAAQERANRVMATSERVSRVATRVGAASRFMAPGGRGGEALAFAGRYVAPAAAVATAVAAEKRFAEVERMMTRIGITADATGKETQEAFREAQQAASDFAMPVDKIVEGMSDLAAQGRNMTEIRAQIRAIAMTAQASGSEVQDIAATASTLGDQLKIAAPNIQRAFDILVAGGKAGKFELKDMSRYLPSLGPAFAAIGYKGEDGLKKLVAMMQVVRNQTGTSEEAAASLRNVITKMESDETANRFKKMGVDLRVEMEKARKDGKDLLDVFVRLSEKALKGDLSKIPQLFADEEFQRGMRALLSQSGAVDRLSASLGKVDGSTLQDLNRVLKDTQAQADRTAAAIDRTKISIGNSLAPAADSLLKIVERTLDGAPPAPPAPGSTASNPSLPQSGAGAEAYNRPDFGFHLRQKTARPNRPHDSMGQRGEIARMAREDRERGLQVMAAGRAAERSVRVFDDSGLLTGLLMNNLNDWLRGRPVAAMRAAENARGRSTYGQDNETIAALTSQLDMRLRDLTTNARFDQKPEANFGARVIADELRPVVQKLMEIDAQREGKPLGDVDARLSELLSAAIDKGQQERNASREKLEVQGEVKGESTVNVVVTPSSALIEAVAEVRKLEMKLRGQMSNAIGSTGKSMPGAAAP